MKKFVCLLGSPRAGANSETICDRILDTAKRKGAETRKVSLNSLSFKGCQACMACKKDADKCVVNDDLAEVLQAVSEADVLLMASPIYFGQVTGQLKCAIDRMYSFLKPDYMTNPAPSRLGPGKKCVFVLTQGNPDSAAFDIYPDYERFFKWFGYEMHVIRGTGLRAPTDAAAKPELMAQAERLAEELLR